MTNDVTPSTCTYACSLIGGPFISVNPECPFHGYSRLRQDEVGNWLGDCGEVLHVEDVRALVEAGPYDSRP